MASSICERTNSKATPQYGLGFRADHRVPVPLEILACKPVSVACELSLWPRLSRAPGNGFRTPETEGPKLPLSSPSSLQRLEAGLCARGKSRVFGGQQEISFSRGLRGGLGRTRTACPGTQSCRTGLRKAHPPKKPRNLATFPYGTPCLARKQLCAWSYLSYRPPLWLIEVLLAVPSLREQHGRLPHIRTWPARPSMACCAFWVFLNWASASGRSFECLAMVSSSKTLRATRRGIFDRLTGRDKRGAPENGPELRTRAAPRPQIGRYAIGA